MKKNLIKTIISFTILGSFSNLVFGETKKEIINEKEVCLEEDNICREEIKSKYFVNIGKIEEINNVDDLVSILVKGSNDKYGTIFHVSEALILDQSNMKRIEVKKLKVGDTVNVYYNVNTPCATSLPPQVVPEVVVLTKDNNPPFVCVDNFNKDGLNAGGNLKITLDNAEIVDVNGKDIPKDSVLGKNLVVFYAETTRSIPAQTVPKKIIVLNDENEMLNIEEDTINNSKIKLTKKAQDFINTLPMESIYKVKNDTFILLYDVANKLGYDIKWEESKREVKLSKGSESYILEIGSKKFNSKLKSYKFENAPFIKNNRTYVEESFIDKLLK